MNDLQAILKDTAVMVGSYELSVEDKQALVKLAKALIEPNQKRAWQRTLNSKA